VKPSAATVWPRNSPNGDPRHAVKLFIRPAFPEILALAAERRFMMLLLNLEVNDIAPRRAVSFLGHDSPPSQLFFFLRIIDLALHPPAASPAARPSAGVWKLEADSS